MGFRKKPFLMGKSGANKRNESSLSNCRVQPALSIKEGRVGFRNKLILKAIFSARYQSIYFMIKSLVLSLM